MRSFPSVFGAALVALAAVTVPRDALANSRYPATNQLFFDPTSPDTLYLRATFGLLASRDHGGHFQWICEGSVGFDGELDPAYAIFAEGRVVACLRDGLRLSSDRACSFAPIANGEVAGHGFIDLTVHATTPSHGFALASGFEGVTDDAGSPLFYNRVFETIDSGVTWTAVSAVLDPTLLIETIDVAPSDPMRVYLSAARGLGQQASGVFLVSTDGGHTFTERPLALEGLERSVFIAGVDPSDAERVYLRTASDLNQPTRLLVTSNAGTTFTTAFSAKGPLAGFALSADGTKVWVGGPADGLYAATKAAPDFVKRNEATIQCLRARDSELWACSNERSSGFVLGLSTDDGATFQSKLGLSTVAGPLDCPAGTSTHDMCAPLWPKLSSELGVDGGGTGTFVDAGTDEPPPAEPPSDEGCSCQSTGSGALSWAGLGGVVLGVAALARRRRR